MTSGLTGGVLDPSTLVATFGLIGLLVALFVWQKFIKLLRIKRKQMKCTNKQNKLIQLTHQLTVQMLN